jgi:hypothetical protein
MIPAPEIAPPAPVEVADVAPSESAAGELVISPADVIEDAEIIEPQPAVVVDTTAELLGRAKPRRPRAVRAVRKTDEERPARRTRQKRATQ